MMPLAAAAAFLRDAVAEPAAALAAIFTVARLLVVVELGYWEVAQTEPEVLRAVLLGLEVPEVSEAAAELLEATGQMVQSLEHLLAVLALYMVAVLVLVDPMFITNVAF
jgi:hypothetical protein